MRLPDPDASHNERVRYGRYVGRRLRRAKRTQLATDADAATALVLQRGREWEDAAGPVQDARADRDAADDDLDDTAKDGRARIAGRSVNAAKEPPYTQIFPDGIDYYTAAPLDQEIARYGQLISRMNEFLAPSDEVRTAAVPALTAGIAAFKAATEAVEQALTAQSIASTRLQQAEDAWATLMTKIYGALVADVGKQAAERFFPKIRSGKKKQSQG
ncbi:MAG: hypothetical protein IPM54_25825 [Polyangiaceae bacterium]|nr:hypothetical protein [Polyangiaceae bacterium]